MLTPRDSIEIGIEGTQMCGGNGWMWNQGYGGWGWGGWFVTAAVIVVIFAVLITAIVAAVRYLSGPAHSGGQAGHAAGRSPEDVLADRFARGDIDDEEYRRRMTLLREHR